MIKEERHTLILGYIAGRDAVSYDDLMKVVHTSPATLRRDVDKLAAAHLLRKVRGGVAPAEQAHERSLAHYFFQGARAIRTAQKDAIARAALGLCTPNDTLILYGGSTVFRLAELLPTSGMTVLTNSLPVVSHLTLNTQNRVFLTGGEVYARPSVVMSPFDEGTTRSVAASHFFIGCQGISAAGILEGDALAIHVNRTLRKQAEKMVVLADSSKFSASRSLLLCRLSEVDIVVTDDGVSDKDHQMLVDAGVRVIVGAV